ncbi:MAG: hypothetical protein DWP95_01270 [Proteobacteria bacterium]|nr:MAG: hypothetical protein DWP95_01270 [Pseudomonadota bacterium]
MKKIEIKNRVLTFVPSGPNPFGWLLFIVLLLLLIPIILLVAVLVPVVLLVNYIRMRFFPNKKPRIFATPFGFTVYSQAQRTLVNYSWHEIAKAEVWQEDGVVFPVLILNNGTQVKLAGIDSDQVKSLCAQHNITFYDDVILSGD